MKTRISMLLCAAGLMVVGAGCRESINMTERANPVGRKQVVQDRRVITDGSLAEMANVVAVNEGRTPDGLLKIQVEVVNTSRQSKNFFYRFEWLDQDGMIVNPAANGYIETQIIGGESRMLTGIAPQKDVVDFRLKMKER